MNYSKIISLAFIISIFSNQFITADVIGTQTAAYSLVLQTNERPVVAGFVNNCDKDQIMIARYLTDGTLDGSLNGLGYNTTIFGGSAAGNAVALQTDGKIVVAGYSDDTIGVLRYTTAGVLDTAYGTGGRVNLNLGINEVANGAVIQSGKALVAGSATVAGTTQFFVTRLNSTGVLDAGFGTSGVTTTPIGDGAGASGVALQSTGKIILAGTAVVSGQVVFALTRYSSSGVLDTTFGSSGISTASIGSFAAARGLAIDSSNKIVVVGIAISGGVNQIAIARFTANGTLDGSFGTSGVVLLDIPVTSVDQGLGVAIQADGNIVVVGQADTDLLVARLEGTNGALDTSFGGGNGYVTSTIGDESSAHAVAIQPSDQMIVVAGFSDLSVLVARYDVDGNLDTTFGPDSLGYIIEPQGSLEATCGACTVCPTGATGPAGATGAVGATGTASLGAYAYYYNSSLNLLLSNSVVTPVPLTAEGAEFNITHSTVTNTDQITLDNAGTYKLSAVVDLTSTTSGVEFNFYQNGSPVAGTSYPLETAGTTVVQAIIPSAAADLVQLVETGLVATTIVGKTSVTVEKIA